MYFLSMLRALNFYAIFCLALKKKKKWALTFFFGPYEIGALGTSLTRLVVGPTLVIIIFLYKNHYSPQNTLSKSFESTSHFLICFSQFDNFHI
jgi:hypothetical protein